MFFVMLGLSMLITSGVVKTTTVFAETGIALPDSSATVNYEAQEISVLLGSNTQLYVGRGTVDKAPAIYDEIMDDSITTVTISGVQKKVAIIDISYLSPSKDEYIYIKGDVTTEALKVLVKKQLKLKATYVGLLNATTDANSQWLGAYSKTASGVKLYPNFTDETGYFQFTVDKTLYTSLEYVEWRKSVTDTWSPLATLDLKKYTALGAQLMFRINSGQEQISTESKVNYTRYANAPNISIDGLKHTIKLTNKIEYRVKVASGAYAAWTTPTCADNKPSGVIAVKDLVGAKVLSNGDGISTNFLDMEVQFRVKATDKKTVSKAKTVDIEVTDSPIFGNTGIEVALVNSADLTKGIKVTNHTNVAYQVSILNKKVSDTVYGAYASIGTVDLNANAKQAGYIAFLNLGAGKSTIIPYAKYKAFEKDYVVVCRIASIKDNTKTPVNEFRIASPIVPVGGDKPRADIASGAVLMDQAQTSINKTIKFTVENPNSEIYIAEGSGAYSLSSNGQYTVSANKGDTKTIKAYSKNKVTNEVSETLTIVLSFVSDGELSNYVNEWGYYLCKTEDTAKSSNSRSIAYQRVYLAYLSYNTSNVSLSDLKLTKQEVYNIVQRVRVDNPELLQATGAISYSSDLAGNVTQVTLDMITKAIADPLLLECKASLDVIKAQILATYGSNPTKVQQVKVVHDYLVLKKQYKASAMDQNIAGALSNNYSPVCMAYSMAFKYVCDELGIQTAVVLGVSGPNSVNHAWNIVNLVDTTTYASAGTIDATKWYEIDVTWDDPVGAATTYVGYSFFNITTTMMQSQQHTRRFDYYSSYPVTDCTGTTYGYESVKPQSNNFNGVSDTTINSDVMQELLKRCGEEKPVMKQVTN
jgi:hypothetical protein